MSAGLIALLDDVAAIAKAAAASVDDVAAAAGRASVKATGVVVDDTAVTPQYVTGVTPDREIPIIWRIAKGSLVNKLAIILPVAMLLSQFVPWLLTPILMIGGAFLSYEGAHKVWDAITGHGHEESDDDQGAAADPEQEKQLVSGAIRTDLILSAEIMVISLNEVANESFWKRLAIMIVVALVMTILVYGVVAVLVKADDLGLRITKHNKRSVIGRGLVNGMPYVLEAISVIGTAAMLWVGGHILLDGASKLGFTAPFDLVHAAEHWVETITPAALAPVLAWLTETLGSAIAGFLVGSVVVGVLALIPHRAPTPETGAETATSEKVASEDAQDASETPATK